MDLGPLLLKVEDIVMSECQHFNGWDWLVQAHIIHDFDMRMQRM